MTFMRKSLLASALVAGALTAQAALAQGTVEVMHWWTSGGEAKALQVLKSDFEKTGGKWTDNPVAGGGGDAAMTALRARALAGNPPSAVQLKGPAIQEWAEQGLLANLNDVARAEGWDRALPPLIVQTMKHKGNYVAAPVNIHRVNWLWVNPEALKKVNAKVPTTWEEFNDTAKKLQAAGIVPIAHGGEPWQDATVFEAVALGIGGPQFFKKVFVDLDEKELGGPTMVKVFDQMRTIRGFMDKDFAGRKWNLSTAMVMNGQAAMQIMGDWAKGEFTAAGKVPGKDFVCAELPGQKGYVLNADSFAMFKVKGAAAEQGQKTLAKLIVGKPFQETFNLLKGSIPARTDVAMDKFDDCAKKSLADLNAANRSGALLPSFAHKMALPPAVEGAMVDVITKHFNSTMSSADATKALVAAVKAAK